MRSFQVWCQHLQDHRISADPANGRASAGHFQPAADPEARGPLRRPAPAMAYHLQIYPLPGTP